MNHSVKRRRQALHQTNHHYYFNISVQAANLSDWRIESNRKNRFGSENRIEWNRNFLARIGMLYWVHACLGRYKQRLSWNRWWCVSRSRSSLSVLISRSPHCSPNNIVSLIDLTGPIAHLLFAEPPKMFVGHRARTRDYSVYLRSVLGQCGRLNQSSPKGNHPVAWNKL